MFICFVVLNGDPTLAGGVLLFPVVIRLAECCSAESWQLEEVQG
jgi:hypothetical protein